ncbi:hypothetical protein [Ensifer sp. ENS08]|uniref:hypothetical protein n=1 Tax=Ensifer sp. ENS08 TaxID=2769273 RepID=UPI0017853F5B|nr:hypothetical protein [Ensifer sp. ENS08]MBD9571743.1 hypothetical protein [Ensifer sp. ENS08]
MSEKSDLEGEEGLELDLFGKPIAPIKDRRGRPSYAKVAENQELVTVLRCAGWNHERIARYIGCDEKTLRKHFSRELDAGADIVEAEALMVTYKRMRQGNSVATGRILDLADKAQLAAPQRRQPAKDPKPEKLGKKAQLDEDAKTGHQNSDWGNLLQ